MRAAMSVSPVFDKGAAYLAIVKTRATSKMLGISIDDVMKATQLPTLARDILSKGLVGNLADPDYGEIAEQYGALVEAFISSLRTRSIFYRLIADEMITRIPIRTRIGAVAVGASAYVPGEARSVPVTRLAFTATGIEPATALAMLVMSEDMMKASGPAAQATFEREMRRAVSHAVDVHFLARMLSDDTPSIASAGADAEDALRDLRSLFAAVGTTAESRPILALAPDVARGAATISTLGGARLFPGMTPTGGDMCGVPAMASDAVEAGTVLLLDGAGIAGDAGPMETEASTQAAVEILESELAQNAPAGTGAALTSLWQTGCIALMTKAAFGAERMRPNAIARLTGVAWGPVEAAS